LSSSADATGGAIVLIFIGASQRQQITGIKRADAFCRSFKFDIIASMFTCMVWLEMKSGLYKIEQSACNSSD
jgi:hypothetical protein